MCEAQFTAAVGKFFSEVLKEFVVKAVPVPDANWDLENLVVQTHARISSGQLPTWEGNRTWRMQEYRREVDVAIGRRVEMGASSEFFLPLVAIENKRDGWLNTDELDAKSYIYSSFKQTYPCLLTCLLLESNEVRCVRNDILLRNGRGFDLIFTDWSDETRRLLRDQLLRHLDYAVCYWGR